MLDSNAVLRLLAQGPWELSAGEIVAHLKPQPKRKQLLEALGRLMQRKLVERVKPMRQANFERIEPHYRLTPGGRDFVAAGKRVTSGPNGPLAGVRDRGQQTFRARLWRALRIARKATIPELIEIARDKTDTEAVPANAFVYLKYLARAGVVAKLPTRERGHAITSPGFTRWALLRDLGPLAPIAAAKHLVDPNATGDARFIGYLGPRTSSSAPDAARPIADEDVRAPRRRA